MGKHRRGSGRRGEGRWEREKKRGEGGPQDMKGGWEEQDRAVAEREGEGRGD